MAENMVAFQIYNNILNKKYMIIFKLSEDKLSIKRDFFLDKNVLYGFNK